MTSLALLVIDMQTGALDGKLIPAIHMGEDLLTKAKTLIDAARREDVPVIYVQHNADEGLLVKETEAWSIHPSIAPADGERIIEKRASSAFEGTDLGKALANEETRGIIVCGLQSEHCVSNTSFDALNRGMDVYVCGDGHSTWSSGEATAVEIIAERNEALAKNGASVVSVSAIVSMLRSKEYCSGARDRPKQITYVQINCDRLFSSGSLGFFLSFPDQIRTIWSKKQRRLNGRYKCGIIKHAIDIVLRIFALRSGVPANAEIAIASFDKIVR
ncbi:MAG: cysteine hydrolase family protein [Pseudomonadota bacterium]